MQLIDLVRATCWKEKPAQTVTVPAPEAPKKPEQQTQEQQHEAAERRTLTLNKKGA